MSVKKMPGRMFLRLRDIQNLTGMTYRTAIRIAKRIRAAYNKADHHPLTIDDYCNYFGVKEEKVREYID